MLRNLLIIADSGLVLFSKDFVNSIDQPRLVGSLFTAVGRFSASHTGLPVSYIEFEKVAVSISKNEESRVTCVLFHDVEDEEEFGGIIASELLRTFIEDYKTELPTQAAVYLKKFQAFHSRMGDAIKGCLRAVLEKLQQQRGVKDAILVSDTTVTTTERSGEIDRLALVANLKAVVLLSKGLLNVVSDYPVVVEMKDGRTGVSVYGVEGVRLVVVTGKSVDDKIIQGAVQNALKLLRKVMQLQSKLQGQKMDALSMYQL